MFQRILVPLDGSSRAEQALPVAARIARASKGSVLLLHIVDNSSNVWVSHITSSFLPQKPTTIEFTQAEKYLKNQTASTIFAGIAAETCVTSGSAASTILSVASSAHADLIVLCSHGYTRMTRWIMGSVAEYVVRHAATPVLLLREGEATLVEHRLNATHALRVLVTLDGSDYAEEALVPAASLVAALATSAQGELHLLRVVKSGASDGVQDLFHQAERYLSMTTERIREGLIAPSLANHNIEITSSVAVAVDVVDAIVKAAEWKEDAKDENASDRYDVIAMATNERKGLQWWTMGSVTEGVLNKTKLPMLIIRPSIEGEQRVESQANENGAQSQKKEFPLTRPGAAYPDNYVIAVIEDGKKAEDAVQSLLDAGISSEDIRLFESHEILKYAEDTEKNQSLLSRIADVFQAITSDDDPHVLIYVEEARRGHAILNVHVPRSEQIERVKDILVAHSARNIKYFGRWSITVLHH